MTISTRSSRVKDAKRFADSGGWGYAVFDDDAASDTFKPGTLAGTPPQGNDAKCGFACHTRVKTRDYVFTETGSGEPTCAAAGSQPRGFSHRGVRPVATGDINRLACLAGAICPLRSDEYATGLCLERYKLRPSLDVDASLSQAIDQETLMLVLRKNQRIWKRADGSAHIAQDACATGFPAGSTMRSSIKSS